MRQTASLVCAGQHTYSFGLFGVGRQSPVHGHVGAQDIGQHDRVLPVGLLP
jgi:hypothetical protein